MSDLEPWDDPPPMDARVPGPVLHLEGRDLWLAYRTRRADHFAVLRFSGVGSIRFGPPDDEHPGHHLLLHAHPRTLGFFHLASGPLVPGGGGAGPHWIANFPDDTLDVGARSAAVVVRAVEAPAAGAALTALLA